MRMNRREVLKEEKEQTKKREYVACSLDKCLDGKMTAKQLIDGFLDKFKLQESSDGNKKGKKAN